MVSTMVVWCKETVDFYTRITVSIVEKFFLDRGDERHSSNTLQPFYSTVNPLSYLAHIVSLHYIEPRLV